LDNLKNLISVALDWSAEGTRPQPMPTEINSNRVSSFLIYFGLRLKVRKHVNNSSVATFGP